MTLRGLVDRTRPNEVFPSMGGENHLTGHGGPWDRGSADAAYGRKSNPHYYVGASYSSELVPAEEMTEEELAAYKDGYESTVFDER